MDEHDLDGRALLVVVGGEKQGLGQPDRECEHGRGDQPRQHALGARQEPGRIGKIDQGHAVFLRRLQTTLVDGGMAAQCGAIGTCHHDLESLAAAAAMTKVKGTATLERDHSSPCRNVAAAANCPSTRLIRVSAHNTVNGVPNGTGPTTAAFDAGYPEDQHRHRQRQHQDRQQQAAAPQGDRNRRPDGADESERRRVPTRRVSATAPDAARFQVEEQAEHRPRR